MTEQTPDVLADLIARVLHDSPTPDRPLTPDTCTVCAESLQKAAHVAAVVRAAQAGETTAQDGRYAGMTTTDALRLVSVNRIRELTIERGAARAEVAALRAARPGREQVAAVLWAADPAAGHRRADDLADAVLALFRQDQP